MTDRSHRCRPGRASRSPNWRAISARRMPSRSIPTCLAARRGRSAAIVAAAAPRASAGLRHQYRLRQAGVEAHCRRRSRRRCSAISSCRMLRRRRRRRPTPIVRLMMALKLVSLGRGASGVRPRDHRAAAGDAGARASVRVVPQQGSVGASGDLAPLAHMTAVMIGEGEALRRRRAHAAAVMRSAAPASRRSCSAPRKAWR